MGLPDLLTGLAFIEKPHNSLKAAADIGPLCAFSVDVFSRVEVHTESCSRQNDRPL
jgi:hypothetical protein